MFGSHFSSLFRRNAPKKSWKPWLLGLMSLGVMSASLSPVTATSSLPTAQENSSH